MPDGLARPSRWRLLVLLTVAALVLAGTAGATLRIKWYTFNDSGCTNQVDPITTIFYNYGTEDLVQMHIADHAGWNPVWFGSPQYFWTDETCLQDVNESASASFYQSRYHIRVKHCEDTYFYPNGCDDTGTLGIVTISDPHYEDITSCGHAVRETVNGWSGYDQARRKLYNTMYTLHYTYTKYLGNSKLLTQCDGGVANSNGYGRWFEIKGSGH